MSMMRHPQAFSGRCRTPRGHDEELPGTHDCGREALEVDAKPATHHHEELVHLVVVPDECALDLHEPELPPVASAMILGYQ
jgi:hypothetical protein